MSNISYDSKYLLFQTFPNINAFFLRSCEICFLPKFRISYLISPGGFAIKQAADAATATDTTNKKRKAENLPQPTPGSQLITKLGNNQ